MDPDNIPTIPAFDPDEGPDPDEEPLTPRLDRHDCSEHEDTEEDDFQND